MFRERALEVSTCVRPSHTEKNNERDPLGRRLTTGWKFLPSLCRGKNPSVTHVTMQSLTIVVAGGKRPTHRSFSIPSRGEKVLIVMLGEEKSVIDSRID